MAQADQQPFQGHLLPAAPQKLPEAQHRLDDPKHGFDGLLAQFVKLLACQRSSLVRPVACLPASTLASSMAKISALSVGCIQIHCRPARIGGNSSRLLSGRRIFSMGVICRSGWLWKGWRIGENNRECCSFRRQNLNEGSTFITTFARSNHRQTQCPYRWATFLFHHCVAIPKIRGVILYLADSASPEGPCGFEPQPPGQVSAIRTYSACS